jgi:hypothetical protein
VPKVFFSDLERGKWECTFDARELGEIIDDDITCMDVVVDERDAFFRAVPSQDRNTCKTEASWANDMDRPSDLNSISSCGIETRVRGYERVELNANPPDA